MVRRGRLWRLLALVMVLGLVAAACGDDDGGDSGSGDGDGGGGGGGGDAAAALAEACGSETVEAALQLQWFAQSQFAGYYAAKDLGFWESVGLDVEILEGAVEIVPATVLGSGAADFAISWVPRGLVPREEGTDMTNIAQVFQRSGTLQVSFEELGIEGVSDLEGTNVGNWGFGNEFELFAGLTANGLDPEADVNLVQQDFNMDAMLAGDIDAAQAMIYNEYAQVLETINPDTGELYQPEQLNVIDWNDEGTAMLQDAIWADESRLADDECYRQTAVNFVQGALEGWAHCRDNSEECVQVVLDNGSVLRDVHQTWQLNEISGLIWPSPDGVGVMDQALWDQTVEVATSQGILAEAPDDGAFRTDIAEEAVANLEAAGVDVTGEGWERIEVQLTEGGE